LTEAENEFLDRIYIEFYKFLTKLAEKHLYDSQKAEDVVQETFIAASKKVKELMQSPKPRGWLVNTLTYKVERENRTRMRFYKIFQEVEDIDALPVTHEDAYDFELLEIFDKPDYTALRLVIVDGYDINEAAAQLGIKYDACRKRIQKAKRQIAQELSL